MADNTPEWYALPTGGYVSTLFTYQSVQIQNAANSVYFQKSTFDAQAAANNSAAPNKYRCKTDYERMQYLIGQFGSVPGASGY